MNISGSLRPLWGDSSLNESNIVGNKSTRHRILWGTNSQGSVHKQRLLKEDQGHPAWIRTRIHLTATSPAPYDWNKSAGNVGGYASVAIYVQHIYYGPNRPIMRAAILRLLDNFTRAIPVPWCLFLPPLGPDPPFPPSELGAPAVKLIMIVMITAAPRTTMKRLLALGKIIATFTTTTTTPIYVYRMSLALVAFCAVKKG